MEIVTALAVIGMITLLAFLAESMTEYLLGEVFGLIQRLNPDAPWLPKFEAVKPTVLKYTSAVVGVALAMFAYNLDLMNLIALIIGAGDAFPHSQVGEFITGLGIGRGANFIHQIVATHIPEYYKIGDL